MILVICEPEDTCGLWLVTEIARRGCSVEHIFPDELAIGSQLSVRVANQHDMVEVRLVDGRYFNGAALFGVINRMNCFPHPALNGVSDRDEVYANEEMRAATVAWFAALPCPVLNPPSPYSAYGMMMHESLWRQRASVLGIRTPALKVASDALVSQPANFSIVVVGQTVLTAGEQPAPPSVSEASIALAQSMGFRLLGLDFNIGPSGEWELVRAQVMPNLMSIGPTSVDALLGEMRKQ